MVSTITLANASQDLLEIAVRLVRLLVIINKLYVLFLSLSLIIGCFFVLFSFVDLFIFI